MTVTPENGSGLTLNPDRLTFTPQDWSQGQTVTVTGAQDPDAVDDGFKLTHTASGGGYQSVSAELPVTVKDDESPGILLSESFLPVAENGEATYTVVLGSRPTGVVTLNLGGAAGTDLTITPNQIVFQRDDWDEPVTVRVKAAADLDTTEDQATLTWTASGGDYENVTASLDVQVPDTISAAIEIDRDLHQLVEQATRSFYNVRLSLEPLGDVTVEVTPIGSPELRVGTTPANGTSPTSATLTFTPENWNEFQKLYVFARGDPDQDPENSMLGHDASGGGYDLAPAVNLQVLVDDNEATRRVVLSRSSLSISESGSGDYTVRLARRPTSDLTLTISGGGSALTVQPSSLPFTPENWNVRQLVAVTAAARVSAQDANLVLTHTGDGGGYASIAPEELPVTILRDVPHIAGGGVSVTSSALHAQDTYARDEVLAIAVTFDRDVTVDTSQGTPHLEATFDPPSSQVRNLGYTGMTGNRTLNFEYTVQASDRDSDGISVQDNALRLNGATVRAASDQRDADLSGTGLGTQANHKVDGGQALAEAGLSGLTLTYNGTPIILTPAFVSGTTGYTAAVATNIDSLDLAYTAAEGGTASVQPADASDTDEGHQVELDSAQTVVTVTVTRPPRPAGTYTLTINRESPTVSIAAVSDTVAYHLGEVGFTVTRNPVSAASLDVDLAFTQSATYLPAGALSRTVTIPANQTTGTLTLDVDDFTAGATEDGSLTAGIAADSNYTIGSDGSADVSMLAANPAITVRPEQARFEFLEDSGQQSIRIVAEAAAGVPVPSGLTFRVIPQRKNGSAVQGLDFLYNTAIIGFEAADFSAQDGRQVASKTFPVTLLDDNAVEGDEDFHFVLQDSGFPDAVVLTRSDGTPCPSSTCQADVLIVDDDSPPSQVTGLVLTPGGGELGVAWDRVPGADGYKVQWKSGAESFSDAATTGRQATISSGSTTSHTIDPLTDGTDYTVRVIATRSTFEGAPSDEAAERPDLPTLTIADASATEGSAVEFTVTLSRAITSDVTVGYTASDVTAVAGADYTAPDANTRLTIGAGDTTGTVTVDTTDDTDGEDSETFTLTLGNPSSNAVLGTAKTATGTIGDNDTTLTSITGVAFTNEPSDGEYGPGEVIEVSVTFDSAVDVTGTPRIPLSLDGSAAADSYALYDAGASSGTVLVFRRTVTTADDDDTDGIGVATDSLELDGGSIVTSGTSLPAGITHGALTGGNVRTRVIYDISIISTPAVGAPAPEGIYGPGENIDFTVSFSEFVVVSSGTPELIFVASDGARQHARYRGRTGSGLVFEWTVPSDVPGNEGGISVPGNVSADGVQLADAGLVLNGGRIINAVGQQVNIRHGDFGTDASVDTTGPALVSGAEGAVVDGDRLVLTFQQVDGSAEHLDENSVPSNTDFLVRVSGFSINGTSVEVDGSEIVLTLDRPAGHAEELRVDYIGDGTIQDLWGNAAANFASRSVHNDSPEPTLTVADVTVSEAGNQATFRVELDIASAEAVTVDYATADGTATAGLDYTATSGTLNIAAGRGSGTIDVPLLEDSLYEGNETFTLILSNPGNATIADDVATATIDDGDSVPTLSIGDASATEGNAVEFTVTMDRASQADVTVEYGTADDTATSDAAHEDGADYTAPAANATLTIARRRDLRHHLHPHRGRHGGRGRRNLHAHALEPVSQCQAGLAVAEQAGDGYDPERRPHTGLHHGRGLHQPAFGRGIQPGRGDRGQRHFRQGGGKCPGRLK